LADLLVTFLGVDWEIRAELLGMADVEERMAKVKEVLLALMAKRGIAPPDSTSAPSKALVPRSNVLVRRPPRPASAAPPSAGGDLQPLQALFEKRRGEFTEAARQATERELARLSGIPPQSAEYSQVRTYIEWLLALPWNKVSEVDAEINLEEARRRLDAEHEGLEAVKRRVVEYLAVYRYDTKSGHTSTNLQPEEAAVRGGAGAQDRCQAQD
jgi:ATP-dependent Lon protease